MSSFPPARRGPLGELVGAGEGTELVLDSGHVGLVAGSAAKNAQPKIADWIRTRSEQH